MLKQSNLKKLDNKQWKQVADVALYSLPLLITTTMSMPISDSHQKWVIYAISVTIVIFKAISKFTSNEEVITESDDTASAV